MIDKEIQPGEVLTKKELNIIFNNIEVINREVVVDGDHAITTCGEDGKLGGMTFCVDAECKCDWPKVEVIG